MASNFAWGIDIGNRALKAVKLVREGDGLRVDDFEVVEHETVLSNAGDNREALVTAALSSFVQRHPFKGGQVAIGVSGQSSFARFIKLPPVEEKKIPEIVRFEAIQQIPFPLDDVEWSYQLFRSEEQPDVEVGIFAMRKELVNQHIKFFTDYDLNVQVVQMNPLAVYNAMYHDQKFNGTTMVIDLGAENTDLIIADNETIWMRSIPIGGNNFTETLVKAFKLPFNKAEDLKRNAATSKYARQIFQAMRPIFADLVAEIQRSVGFYASVHRDSRIKKILALGGTFKLPGLQKYLQQNLQLDLERLDSLAAAPSSESKLAPTFNENILSIVSAYGLAIQAMNEGKINSNLLPAKIRREKLWKEKMPLFGAAAALFVLGAGIGVGRYWLDNLSYAKAAQTRTQIAGIASQAKALDASWSNEVENVGAADRQKILNIKGLESYRSFWPSLLVDIHSALPQARPAIKKEQPQLLSADPAEIKKIPREQRKQILIDSIVTVYYPDASTPMSAPDLTTFVGTDPAQFQRTIDPSMGGGGLGGGGVGDNPGGMEQPPQPQQPTGPSSAGGAAGAQRGFLVTLRCVSPNANAQELMNKELFPALKAIAPDAANPHKEYSVVKPTIVTARKIMEDETRKQKIKTEYDQAVSRAQQALQQTTPPGGTDPTGGLGNTGGGVNPNQPVDPNDPTPFLDRDLQEDVRQDWEITLCFFVLLDPKPFEPGQPAQPGQPAAPAPAGQHANAGGH